MRNEFEIVAPNDVAENVIILPTPHLNTEYHIQITFPFGIITPAYSIKNKTVTGFTILFASPPIHDMRIQINTCDNLVSDYSSASPLPPDKYCAAAWHGVEWTGKRREPVASGPAVTYDENEPPFTNTVNPLYAETIKASDPLIFTDIEERLDITDIEQKIEERLDKMERVLEEMMQEISALGRKIERY